MSESGLTFEELIGQAQAGDPAAQEELAVRYQPTVRKYALHLLDRRFRGYAEDVSQDVLLTVQRSLAYRSFPAEAAFRGWLRTIVRNRVFDLQKRPQAKEGPSLQDSAGTQSGSACVRLVDLVPSPVASPSSMARRHEAVDAVTQILRRLPEHYREIIQLIVVQRLSHGEAARLLGKSPEATRKQLERAIRHVGQLLGSGHDPNA